MTVLQTPIRFGRVSQLLFDKESVIVAKGKSLDLEDAARSLIHQVQDEAGRKADYFQYKGKVYFVEDTATDTDATEFIQKKLKAPERGKSTSCVYNEYVRKAEEKPREVAVMYTGDAVEKGLIDSKPSWTEGFLKNTVLILFKDKLLTPV